MIALKNPSAKFFTGQVACITFDNIEKFCSATNFLDLNLAEFYFLFPKSAKKKVFFVYLHFMYGYRANTYKQLY